MKLKYYEVGGEPQSEPENFMLLSSSANRAKSWSCEHCENWITVRDKSICLSCYWAYPENYSRIAMKEIRRIDLLWQGQAASLREIKAENKGFSQRRRVRKEKPFYTDPILVFCRRRTQTDTDSYTKTEYGIYAENMP